MMAWHRWRHIAIIGLILLICVAPLWFSRVLMHRASVQQWSNNAVGTLIQPVDVSSYQLLSDGKTIFFGSLTKRWHMVYVSNECCDSVCQTSLLHLNQIRRAIKNAWSHTDVVLVEPASCTQSLPPKMKPTVLRMTRQQRQTWLLFLPKSLQHSQEAGSQVYLVDPRAYLMMGYSGKDPAMKVFKDLKHVLWVTRGNRE